MPSERDHEPQTAVPTTRDELLTITLEPGQSRSHIGSPARTKLETADPDDARTLSILREADESGAFGTNRFHRRRIGPSLYEVEIYPGAAAELLR
jgi:hypothetical protein